MCDLVDTIPELYNPLQNDYDSDGMACPDNCPFISNADQLDSDGDGEGDGNLTSLILSVPDLNVSCSV